jgi:endonuclease III
MSIPDRAAVLTKLYRVLKKQYSPIPATTGRTVLEELLFACLLENNQHAAAEQAYASLVGAFYDWNEIRVSSAKELAEEMRGLSNPEDSANRLKNSLHGVFESIYQFDLEEMKKQNIGAAEKKLASFNGTTRFVVAYVVQQALSGHSIPLDKGSLQALYILGAATEKEAVAGKVPGLERAISKKNGIEFGSLLHQIGVEVNASPYSPKTRKALLDLAPDCKDRLPKRPAKPKKEEPPKKPAKKVAASKPEKKPAKKAPGKPAKKTPAKKAPAKKVVTKKAAAKKPAKKTAAKKTVKKKIVKKPAKKAAKKKATKKTATKRITKRKPR